MKPDYTHAVAADFVFDGALLQRDRAVIIEGARIRAVVDRHDVPASMPTEALPPGAWLAPGFIDIQVNGGGDMLFNDSPTPETLATIAAAHRRFGTIGMLPTLISDTSEKMHAASIAVAEAMQDNPAILGIHFEGPLLSREKPGVHDPAMLRGVQPDDIVLLTGLRSGTTLVTLAPECVPQGFIAQLCAAGVRVALGHSMATYDETRLAIAEGLRGFTHLFNAMRPLSARDPGPIAAALEREDAWYGIIVDGVHVHPAVLRLAFSSGARPMLVTDAMPPAGGEKTSFKLYGNTIRAADGRCLREDGTLAGSMLDMATAVRNAVKLLGLPLKRALVAASTEPARFLGLAERLGRLDAGYDASMIALEPQAIAVLKTWLAGRA